MPLVEGPQDYVQVDAALPSAVNFGPAERARMVKQSVDVCEKKGVLGSGYIPKIYQTTCTANSEGLFAYYHYAEASFILTCRTPDGSGSGWAGTTGVKDVSLIDADATDRGRRRQGAQEPEAARDRAGQLHGHPRAAAGARFLSLMTGLFNARDRRKARSATTSAGKQPRDDEARREAVRRHVHAQERHRQPDPAADADRHRRHGRARPVTWVEKGVLKNLFYDRLWAKRQKKDADAGRHRPEPGDGRLGHVDRADDQVHQARPARHVLLVHPRRSTS